MEDIQTKFTVNDGTATLECARGVTVDAGGSKPDEDWISLEMQDVNLRFMSNARMSLHEARALTECLMHYLNMQEG